MDEQEYQPVRIAPSDGKRHWHSDPISTAERCNGPLRDFLVGKIILVRPCSEEGWICGGRIFEWHPDSVRKLIPEEHYCLGMTTCEHQIQAD